MEKKMNPRDAANYLVTLYKQTKYECNKRKLQKLVIYSDMLYYINSGYTGRLLEDTEVTATERGLSIDKISNSVYALIFNHINAREEIPAETVDGNKVYNLIAEYNYNFNNLNETERALLLKIFLLFGAYSGEDLTEISRKTNIWKEARKQTAGYVTQSIYDSYIKEMDEKQLIATLKGYIE